MKDDLVRDKAIEKLVAGKLRTQLKAPGADCADAQTLAAYVEQTLTPRERRTWEIHLAACSRCQEQVAELVRLGEAEAPAEVLGTATAAPVPWTKFPRFRWAWAAPAMVALLVAGLWYTGEFRPLLQQSQETALKAPAPVQAPPAPSEPQGRRDISGPSTRDEAAKAQPRDKEKAGSALGAGPAVDVPKTSVPAPQSRGELGGLVGAGAATDHLVGAQQGAIATPSERARLAVAGSRVSGGAGSGVGRAIEADTVTKEDRAATRAERPAPLAPGALKPDREKAAEKKSVVQEEAGKKQAAMAELSAPRVAPTFADRPQAAWKVGDWRVGLRGLIQKADSMGNWVTQVSGVEADLFDIAFPSPAVGWAVGQRGTILRTTDGGTTWSRIPSPTTDDLVRVTARGDLTARVITRQGEALATTDGGKSWSVSRPE